MRKYLPGFTRSMPQRESVITLSVTLNNQTSIFFSEVSVSNWFSCNPSCSTVSHCYFTNNVYYACNSCNSCSSRIFKKNPRPCFLGFWARLVWFGLVSLTKNRQQLTTARLTTQRFCMEQNSPVWKNAESSAWCKPTLIVPSIFCHRVWLVWFQLLKMLQRSFGEDTESLGVVCSMWKDASSIPTMPSFCSFLLRWAGFRHLRICLIALKLTCLCGLDRALFHYFHVFYLNLTIR